MLDFLDLERIQILEIGVRSVLSHSDLLRYPYLGSGCSTPAEHSRPEREVVSSNPTRY